jgi:hypothetical protein
VALTSVGTLIYGVHTLIVLATFAPCNCSAQKTAAVPAHETEICEDTCRCTEQQGCGANNGVCDEAAPVALRIQRGTYSKERGCVAGHCCAPHTDGSDCAAHGYSTCRLPGEIDRQGETIEEEFVRTPAVGKFIYFVYLAVGFLYVNGCLPATEGEVTQQQMRAARQRTMGIRAYRVHRRLYISVANPTLVLICMSPIPYKWQWLVMIPVILAVAMNQWFPEEFRSVWLKTDICFARIMRAKPITAAQVGTAADPNGALNEPPLVPASLVIRSGDVVGVEPSISAQLIGGINAHNPVVVHSDYTRNSFLHGVQQVTPSEWATYRAYQDTSIEIISSILQAHRDPVLEPVPEPEPEPEPELEPEPEPEPEPELEPTPTLEQDTTRTNLSPLYDTVDV